MMTILTSLGTLGSATSTVHVTGRGYIHAQFRCGSAVSDPIVALSLLSATIALQRKMLGGDDNMWADVQTWAVVGTEIMPGRDFVYLTAEQEADFRLSIKSWTAGIIQARLWGG